LLREVILYLCHNPSLYKLMQALNNAILTSTEHFLSQRRSGVLVLVNKLRISHCVCYHHHRVCLQCYHMPLNTCTVRVKKSSPPKTFCNIFTQVKYISVKFCQYVASLYLHIFTNFVRFILIFNKMALIFLGVPIVFNVFSFKFHQVK